MPMSSQGLIYDATEDADIINLENGETFWKKPLEFNRADKVVSTYYKKPGYAIDEMDIVLYYLSDDQTISIFKI